MALLGYLLLHRDEELTRDHVAFTLWPDLPESASRTKLRRYLHYLLTLGLPREVDIPWILSDKRMIRWNPVADARIDLDEFLRFGADSETYEPAIDLYRGELLSDLDEEWLRAPRADLRERYLSMLTTLTDRTRSSGDHANTCLYAKRILNVDPWREKALRALMAAMHASGDRTGAVRVYRDFAESLRTEMGLEPSPATFQLYEQLSTAAGPPSDLQNTTGRNTDRRLRLDNLPADITSFVGREGEIRNLRDLILERRLVTLTGVGGIGKSRLAIETARTLLDQIPDGIWLVELASIQEPESVASRIGTVIDVRERPGEAIIDTLSSQLKPRALLIILDNCEHLIGAVATVAERLLRECKDLRILATSREPLRILGEHLEQVEPLPTLGDAEIRIPTLVELSTTPATRLFMLRAADRNKNLRNPQLDSEGRRAIAAIAQRLEGIPLAIELAAASTDMFTLTELEQALDRRFELLTAGSRTAPARQQTLRATLDWSYGMLSAPEQRVFERLGVFRGGWSLEAARFVCVDLEVSEHAIHQCLARLIETSLINATERGQFRGYSMLETMRLYALERLALRGEVEQLRYRHLEWCISVAESANGPWIRPEAARCTRVLKPELDNILQALHWGFSSRNKTLGIRLVHAARTALSMICINEMSRWIQKTLKGTHRGISIEIEGDLLWDLTAIRYQETGNVGEWVRGWEQVLGIYRELPDRRREALALSRLVEVYHLIEADDKATEASNAALSLAHGLGDRAILGYALVAKAFSLSAADIVARRKFILKGIACLEDAGEVSSSARAHVVLAELEFESGNVDRAIETSTHAVELFESLELPHFTQVPRTNIPMYLNAANRFVEALETGCGLLPYQQKNGQTTSAVWCLLHVAFAGAHLGALEVSARIAGFFRSNMRDRGMAMWQTDAREYHELMAFLDDGIDATALTSLLQEGELLTPSEAIALALTLPGRCLPSTAQSRGELASTH
jgi:predicted ATPase/DNA-binding SARP family transcriptional activator